MNILIGSRALHHWYPDVSISEDTDWDIISKEPIEGAEHHSLDVLNNSKVEEFLSGYCLPTINFKGLDIVVADPVTLYLIKRSHIHRELGWDKSIVHLHKYLDSFGETKAYLTGDQLDFLEERTRLTLEQYPQVKPNLNQLNEDFFNDAVTKKYNHDYLHELFAYEEQPLYKKLQTDSSKAWCHQNLWYTLTHQQQLQCVAEETMVIASERFLIPKDWNYPSKLAYMKALKKVCTTLCSGWFRDFAIDNYPRVLSLYNPDKFIEVKQTLEGVNYEN